MASDFLDQDQNLQLLIDSIPGKDREVFKSFRHLRAESAFNDRILVVFKPTGLNELNEHRPPDIHTTLRVVDLRVHSDDGAVARIRDDNTGEFQDIDYTPRRLFGYDVFASLPPNMSLRWDARIMDDSRAVKRSMSWLMLIKTKTRADWYSAGVTQAETPNSFRRLFPKSPLMFA